MRAHRAHRAPTEEPTERKREKKEGKASFQRLSYFVGEMDDLILAWITLSVAVEHDLHGFEQF
jgi:hypothetical protein